jgi:hypothetical protein
MKIKSVTGNNCLFSQINFLKKYAFNAQLFVDAMRKTSYGLKIVRNNMHNLPSLEIISAFVGILAALQGLSILLTNLDIAAKRIEGRSTWIARDGTAFEEFAVSELASSNIMKQDFEESSSESILAGTSLPSNG